MNRTPQGRLVPARLPWLAAGLFGLNLALQAAPSFLGVAAGDAAPTEATLWTRVVDSNTPAAVVLTAQVSADAGFGSGVLSFPVTTDVTRDFSAKLTVTGLTPGTRYFYRFTDGNVTSDTGRFTTPPAATEARPVRFAFSGDVDGLIRPYALASQIPAKNYDFFVFDGDTIYETSASIGSPAVASTGTIPAPSTNGATAATLKADFSRKYREQYLPVNAGGQPALKAFYTGQGNYTMLDNHELGNKQYINGGAPAGGPVGDMATGAGVDARQPAFDINTSAADYMNRSTGFQTMLQAYLDHQPVKDRGAVSSPADPRTDGSKQLYFAQQWGRNLLFVNVDDRSYRDIRIKKASDGSDDTGSRADNTNRTILGATQLAWLEQTLLAAEQAGVPWKIVNLSNPIDQIGPIGGTLSLSNAPSAADYGTLGTLTVITPTLATTSSKTVTVASTVGLVAGQPVSGPGVAANTVISAINTDGTTFTLNNAATLFAGLPLSLAGAPSTYAPVNNDGGKAWAGGYRAERNALLKFIADNKIRNVVFLATDDHQNRVNELTYSPTGDTANQASYVKVPYAFAIVCGPLGATGPDFISNHSFALAKKLADSIANAQIAAGLEPIGLTGYPGLHDVARDGDPAAATAPQPADFYSPDTFNYNQLEISPDGKTLTVTSYGINSTTQNSFLEYDPLNNPERKLFSFAVDAAPAATPEPQTIAFDALPPVEFTNGLSIPLPANSSAGLPITYVVESGPATISNGKLVITGVGRIVVTASQPGTGRLIAAATPVTRTIEIKPATISFLGIAAGDAAPTEATLWTRAVASNAPAAVVLTAQVSADAGFGSGVLSFPVTTDVTRDFSAKLTVTGLTPGTRYFYRFTDGNVTSDTGRFTTPPAATEARPVRFAFSGDVDGLIRPYALASQIPAKNYDFFVFDGDTIYETSASIGSPAVASTGTIPAPSTNGATAATLKADFSRKYREQYLPVNAGGQPALKAFYTGQGNYTMLDNHELGNKQYINGGAPAGGPVGDMATGAGVDARQPAFDINTSAADYMNRSTGFQTMLQAYLDHQPVKDRGAVSSPADPRTDGSKQLYFAQQWGRNLLFVNVDDRSYRDIRIKKASDGSDDTGSRADNTNRTILGATQLAWLEQTLLAAEQAGVPWKIVNLSNPIDQIGPIGGTLSLSNAPSAADYGTLGTLTVITPTLATTSSKTVTVASTVGLVAGQPVSGPGVAANTVISAINTDGTTFTLNNAATLFAGLPLSLAGAPSTYAPVNNDGGKAWAGGYRAERNALLKFIADNKIRNVVFLATDDHQNRVNELTYSPTGDTANQASYVKVPYAFAIVCGPLGATGPDFISNHSFALAKKLADSIANAQIAAGLEPIGLTGYPGLHDVARDGDPAAATAPQPADFYSPDTFNYNQLEISPDGKTLTVTSYGINSTTQNSFLEYDPLNNPERKLFSFAVDAAPPGVPVAQTIQFPAPASAEFANGLTRPLSASSTSGLPITYSVVSGPATVSGATLQITGAGTVVVSASQPGDGVSYKPATPVTQSVTISKGHQSVSFAALSPVQFFPGLAQALNATSSSGLPVSMRLVSGPGFLVNNQVLSLNGAGLIVLAASQAGDANYLPAAEVTQTLRVFGDSQTVTFAAPADTTFAPGRTLTLQAAASTGLPVRFAVESGPATVAGNVLTLTGAGTVTVSAIQDGTIVYSPSAPALRSFNVGRGVQTIEFGAIPGVPFGRAPLVLSAKSSSGLPVEYTVVSGPAVLDSNRLIGSGVGAVVIAATQPGNVDYLPAARVTQTTQVIPGFEVVLPRSGSAGAARLQVWLDAGVKGVVEESLDLKSWAPIGQATGLGFFDPAELPLTSAQTSGTGRYWRVRVSP